MSNAYPFEFGWKKSGREYIAILAGESRDPARSIGQSVIVSSPVICAMFILGTATIEISPTPSSA